MTRHASPGLLSSYLDQDLSSDDVRRLEKHLEECDECTARLEGLGRVVGALRSLGPVDPPKSLGFELQRHLARATPPFAEPAATGGLRRSRTLLQPMVLAGIGVVLALAVIVLLFLQALQSGNRPDTEPTSPPAVADGDRAMVGDREFRRSGRVWVESSLSPAQIEAAKDVDRDGLNATDLEEIGAVLEVLSDAVVLELDGRVVRLAPVAGQSGS